VPNGKLYYNSGDEKVIGFFVNGLANGSWDRTEMRQNRITHTHQEFLNGIPNGEWYEEVDGIRWYSHTFLNGKPNGIWTDNIDKNKKRETEYKNGAKNGICKTTKNDKIEQLYYYSNGIINGDYFEYSSNTLVKKGSYDMGKPNKIWETYKIDKTTKIRYLAYHYNFSNILQVKISEYYSNSKLKKIEIYENNGDLIIGGTSSSRIVNCNQNNGVCNKETKTYFANGNVEKNVYSGSKEYLANKKFILNYENGKTKYEGTYGGNIFYYDTAGKIVNQTVFSIEAFNDVNAN
jgi:antitoxin component YwqK of YwqJK toxin-antitoxin module